MKDLIFYLADDDLVLGYRDTEWTGFGPFLEDFHQLHKMGLPMRVCSMRLYEIIGNPDNFVYKRKPEEFRNAYILELKDDDYTFTL